MKKFLLAFAMLIANIVAMAQSQFYVIMKDGSGTSFPESVVDSLTFNDINGAKIYGFNDLANSIAQLRREVDSLKKVMSTISSIDSSEFMHEYVNLGLPSGTLWATCNVGAKKPENFGLYFQWGVTEAGLNFPQQGGKWYSTSVSELRSKGVIDSYLCLTPEYDAATVYWGEDWCMPSKQEMWELVNLCSHKWVEQNGVNGIEFTGSNGNSIFLPCAGFKRGTEGTVLEGTRGYYMSASSGEDTYTAAQIYLSQESVSVGTLNRSYGRVIRPVRRKESHKPYIDTRFPEVNGHVFVDLGLPSKNLWAETNVGASKNSDRGNLFAWGETAPKDTFTEENSKWYGLEKDELVKAGVMDNNYILNLDFDAAYVNWGASWKIPSQADFLELYENCKHEIVERDGVTGWLFIGPNKKSLFFPFGYYWENHYGWRDEISDNQEENWGSPVYKGHYVRPILIK